MKAGLLDLVESRSSMAGRRGGTVRCCGWITPATTIGAPAAPLAGWRIYGRVATRHGLLGWEGAAILQLFETWVRINRSHRKLAHRGSRIELVHVSESTVLRVLAAEGRGCR